MKCYTLAVQTSREWLQRGLIARRLPGCIGSCEDGMGISVMAFTERKYAERARRVLMLAGCRVGKYIMDADADLKAQQIQVHGPADGWDSVDPGDLVVDSKGQRGLVQRYQN